MSSAAPTVIALSATLNAGHDQPRVVEQQEVDDVARASGGPRGCRARRRGSAPGRGSSSAAAAAPQQPHDERPRRRARCAAKNQRCQPPAPARKLNAAPVLYASTRLKKRRDRQLLARAERREHRAPWSPGRATITAAAQPRASAASVPRAARVASITASRRSGEARAARRRRRGSPRSGRTASGARDRRRRRRASASSARTSACALGVTAIASAAPGATVAADVISTKRRSSPRLASAA